MNIVVTGGRDFTATDVVYGALDTLHRQTTIEMLAHGACGVSQRGRSAVCNGRIRGADGLADEWASAHGVACIQYPVNCDVDGPWPAAGQRRNGRMLIAERGRAPLVVAFDGGRGTNGCIRQALRLGLRVWRVHGTGPWWTEVLDGGKERG